MKTDVSNLSGAHATQENQTYRVAALSWEVWQKRKRSSFRPLVKAYLDDIVGDDRDSGTTGNGKKVDNGRLSP